MTKNLRAGRWMLAYQMWQARKTIRSLTRAEAEANAKDDWRLALAFKSRREGWIDTLTALRTVSASLRGVA